MFTALSATHIEFFCNWPIFYASAQRSVAREAYCFCDFQVMGSNLTAGHLQATLSKLLTYGMFVSTQPPTLRGTGNE